MPNYKTRTKRTPRIANGDVVSENLPLPWVHYPGSYGTLIAYSEFEESEPCFCSCSIPLINNYLELRRVYPEPLNANKLRMAHLAVPYFPEFAAKRSTEPGFTPLQDLTFKEGVCHRCNQITPSLRYCLEMYGTAFVQCYGWYINQVFLRLGILRWGMIALEGVCPDEVLEKVYLFKVLQQEMRDGAPADPWERTKYFHLRRNDRTNAQAKRAITRIAEDEARLEFGFRKVGEGWISESILAALVQRIFYGRPMLRHHRPEWLGGLELDIFFPDIRIAFEYQGQQHYMAVDVWGGEEAFAKLKERDQTKARICAKSGITLIPISFQEPLTGEHVRSRIPDNLWVFESRSERMDT